MTTVLKTERLLLRHLELDDLDLLHQIYSDEAVRLYIPDAPTSRAETLAEIEWHRHGHPDDPRLGLWATIDRESGRLIGRCGLLPWSIDGQHEVEVAYLIDRPFWGRGLGTEAALAIRDYGFYQLGLTRLICLIDEHNLPSIKVAERLGMRFEKAGEDELGPFWVYGCERP